jgi:2'-5' RNA ligase
MTMARFNIALLPVEARFQKLFANVAGTYFKPLHSEYILGPHALAHVTLCQFEAPDEAAARALFASCPGQSRQHVQLEDMQIQVGTAEHAGKFWAHFPVEKTTALSEQQRACFEHLSGAGRTVFNPPETYTPHLTLARLLGLPLISLQDMALPYADPILMRPALGRSTRVGVFVSELRAA